MSKLVSILIPAYNAERWLAFTMRSALAQTWPTKEIIVVDDGSRDGTLAIARGFQSGCVKVVSQPNMGAAAARNRAMALAQGAYIQWLDADDLLAPDKIIQQIQLAEQYRDPWVLFSSSWASFMYRPRAAQFRPTPLWRDHPPLQWMTQKWLHNAHMQTATWLVSRELSMAAGPWNTELLGDDDGEYFARVVLASRRVCFAIGARTFYRVVGTNRLSYIGRSDRKLEAHLRGMELQIGYLRRIDDGPAARTAIVKYLETWLPIFYPERPDLVEKMKSLAGSVGAELKMPQMSLKYAWIDTLFGRVAAKRAQLHYNVGKTFVLRSLDRSLSAFGPQYPDVSGHDVEVAASLHAEARGDTRTR
jgi:glycosyltransferase involved in cell wall biosynthesis